MSMQCRRCGGNIESGEEPVNCTKCGSAYHRGCIKGEPTHPEEFAYGYICDNCHIQQNWGKIEKEKGWCFIATAAYGSAMADEIQVLRKWRDESLLKMKSGRLFVNVYYTISPSIADFIAKSNTLKVHTRRMLRPIIRVLKRRYRMNS